MQRWAKALFIGFAVTLLLTGIALRFTWIDWSQGTNLHPDEYGLTNTLTQLSLPNSLSDYFNTRLSPLSPYPKYDLAGIKIAGGPDNGMRWGQWPMIIIRTAAEMTGNTGYNELRLLGRTLSAAADVLTLLLIFLIGRRLYGWKAGLLAAALSSLAVMQIQQSHFMTVDNFAGLFTALAVYACVRIAQSPCAARGQPTSRLGQPASGYLPDWNALRWYGLFGVALGMALASKINLLPLAGIVLVAAFISIADLRLRAARDLRRIIGITLLFTVVSFLAAAVTFRLAQPMSFRLPTGDTGLFSVHLNPDWVGNMKTAQLESSGVGGGPPGEQWTKRPILVFPLVNMLFWGMGLPLGVMSWIGVLWASWRLLKTGEGWRSHLIPLAWAGGYFLFMGTRWVASMRYFLPIYPFLCLFAAWGLIEIWKRACLSNAPALAGPGTPSHRTNPGTSGRMLVPLAVTAIVTLGTLAWALAFTNAVYRQDHSRIRATRWIVQNVAAPFHLTLQAPDGSLTHQPVPAPDGLQVTSVSPYIYSFVASSSGTLSNVVIPHASALGFDERLRVSITCDPEGTILVDEVLVPVPPEKIGSPGPEVKGTFRGAALEAGETYYLIASSPDSTIITISRAVIANETWDEGLPFPFDGIDPFYELYRGILMEVRWYDDENKRQMFLDTIAQADYIILPSQRAIWSTCRLPLTYPMTMEYYDALFDGRLGFDRVASFSSPISIGPLAISDVGGSLAWNSVPSLPLFNNRLLSAEEAFSVYDHPPVWIFKKRPDFDLAAVRQVLESVDLSTVVIQSPRDAAGPPCEQRE